MARDEGGGAGATEGGQVDGAAPALGRAGAVSASVAAAGAVGGVRSALDERSRMKDKGQLVFVATV